MAKVTRIADLPPRAREQAEHLCKGYSIKESAEAIGVAYHTAKNSRLDAKKMLGVESDLQVFAIAMRELIQTNPSLALEMIEQVLP